MNLADYLVDVLAGLTDEQVQTMLNCEFGGMNEAFAQVYALTGDKKYLDASYRFYHRRLMEPLAEGERYPARIAFEYPDTEDHR